MDPDWVRRTDHLLAPDPTRVVALLFLPGQEPSSPGRSRSSGVIDRVLALSDREVDDRLTGLADAFGSRHRDIEATWEAHFDLVRHRLAGTAVRSTRRRRLIGAYFSQELALEGAGLVNPSMVAHPDQSGLAPGSTRFVMTLRAIGEGHLSSVELRTGTIDAADQVRLDPPPTVAVLPVPGSPVYSRAAFAHALQDVGDQHATAEDVADAAFVLATLPERFGDADLDRALEVLHAQAVTRGSTWRAAERFREVAGGTYAVAFPPGSELQERVLMPRAPAEHRGMEDVRMVRYVGPGGAVEYLGTYTAYDGRSVGSQLLRTTDFLGFTSTPLSGPGAQNKGLAVFPRQVDGRFVALSRADRENNAITTSTDLLHWDDPVRVQVPRHPWEIVQLGNGGSPIETDQGWLVLTHGVGPMRTYSIGALLLDLADPTRVLGGLSTPLLTATEAERSGYVPNVVYSCGAMLHGRTLVLPYGCSDDRTRIALVDLDALLDALRPDRRAGVRPTNPHEGET